MAIVLDSVRAALSEAFKQTKYTRIDIQGIIDKNVGRRVSRQIDDAVEVAHEPGKVIFIFIDSKGGSLYSALQIVNAMNRAKRFCTVATVVNTLAFSAAVVIFQSADTGFRFIAPDGYLMLHQATLRDVRPHSLAQAEHNVEHLGKLQQRIREILTAVYCKNQTNIMRRFLIDLEQHKQIDWYLSAEEAMHYGLADHKEVPAFLHDFQYRGKVLLSDHSIDVPDKIADRGWRTR